MASTTTGYSAFISYSHAADGRLAPALQRGLHRLAKPWYRLSSIRVFRDTTSLTASPGLWSSIEEALAQSDFFILMGSPDAAASRWVRQEVEWWLKHKPRRHLLIVVTDGIVEWEDTRNRFSDSTTALPPLLHRAFTEEPLWVDMRWARTSEHVYLRYPRFRDAIADLAAPLHGVPKEQLVGEDVHQQKRTTNVARGAVALLLTLTLSSVVAATTAVVQRENAVRGQRIAIAHSMLTEADHISDRNPRSALQLGIAASGLEPGPVTRSALTERLTSSAYGGLIPAAGVNDISHAAKAQILATVSGRTVRLWKVADSKKPHRIGDSLIHSGPVMSVALDAEASILAVAGGGVITFWDLTTRDRPRKLGTFSSITNNNELPMRGEFGQVLFSPDGETLALGRQDGQITLLDLTDRSQVRTIGQSVTAVGGPMTFSADGRTLYTNGGNGTVLLWDVGGRDQAWPVGELVLIGSDTVHAMAVSPDGTAAVAERGDIVGRADAVTLWDLTDREKPRRIGEPLTLESARSRSLTFSPDGRKLATAGTDQAVTVWDLSNRDQPQQLSENNIMQMSSVRALELTLDGILVTLSADGVLLWDVQDRYRPHRLGRSPLGEDGTANSEALAPNGRSSAVVSAQGLSLWDLAEPLKPRRVGHPFLPEGTRAFGGRFGLVAFSGDGRVLAAVNPGITLWDVAHPEHPHQLGAISPDELGVVALAAFSRDGHVLATARDATVTLWDLADPTRPRQAREIPPNASSISDMALSFDGTVLTLHGQDQKVTVWNLANRDRPVPSESPVQVEGGLVTSIALAPDGNTLAITSIDHTIALWDLTDRHRPRRLGQPLTGHKEWVMSAVFSGDSKTLASSSFDRTLMLWDLTDRDRPHRLGSPTPLGQVALGVVFTSDGRAVATLGDNRSLWDLWDLSLLHDLQQDPVREACLRTGGSLDEEAWRFYAPGLDYEDTCSAS